MGVAEVGGRGEAGQGPDAAFQRGLRAAGASQARPESSSFSRLKIAVKEVTDSWGSLAAVPPLPVATSPSLTE